MFIHFVKNRVRTLSQRERGERGASERMRVNDGGGWEAVAAESGGINRETRSRFCLILDLISAHFTPPLALLDSHLSVRTQNSDKNMKVENVKVSAESIKSSSSDSEETPTELPEHVQENSLQENDDCQLVTIPEDIETTTDVPLTPEIIGQTLWRISIAFDESRRKSVSAPCPSRKR